MGAHEKSALYASRILSGVLKIGLDIGTGFVKCVSDHGSVMFPSLYVKRTHGDWATADSEAVGERAASMLHTAGAATVRPVIRGRPDPRYQRQVEMLVREAVSRVRAAAGRRADAGEKARMAVGLPYEASDCRESVARLVRKCVPADRCDVVAQAVGTLVDMDRSTGMVVSVGQGTSEIIVIEDNQVIDGESSRWASDFITRKIGRFAHLDPGALDRRRDTCKKYAKVLAHNLAAEIEDMSSGYGHAYDIVLSGGGLLIPGVRDELHARLKGHRISVPADPVMSNAAGLYKLLLE